MNLNPGKRGIFLLTALLVLAGAAFTQDMAYDLMLRGLLARNVKEVTVAQLRTNHATATLLDARAYREYEVSHLMGARYVGYDDFNLSRIADLSRNAPVVVYCSVGYRSEKIAQKLQQAGFSEVYNLYGGIFEWVNQGYPVVNAEGRTKQVHAFDRVWGIWLKKGEKVYK